MPNLENAVIPHQQVYFKNFGLVLQIYISPGRIQFPVTSERPLLLVDQVPSQKCGNFSQPPLLV